MNDTQEKSLSERVLTTIETQKLSMHSKAYFTMKMLLLILLTSSILLLSVSLCSFIFFMVRQSGTRELLSFGPHGFILFFKLFPWGLMVTDLLCMSALAILISHFSVGYRNPLLYGVIGLFIITLCLALVVDYTRLNDSFLQHARNQHVFMVGDIYDNNRKPPSLERGVCRCVLLGIHDNILTMREDNPFGSTTVIGVVPSTIATSSLFINEKVFIIGSFGSGRLYIQDIHQSQLR